MARGLKSIPAVVQLPGGVKLQAVPFKVIERDDEGRPVKFEIMPKDRSEDADWHLFAHEASIRAGTK